MDNRLFLMSNGVAVEMSEQKYEKEDYLQKIVEDNPHLLARAWGEDERRLYLVKRELQIMEAEDSFNSYSLDHLLVGEDAVPVLVEVKRSSDTRIRREVVAQMIDYACRASSWNAEDLRRMFIENNKSDVVEEFDTDEFWAQVATNLKAEHLRLVFVADTIPATLRVMIEFLDRQMPELEIYGVELRPYTTNDALMLSSSIVGNSLIEKQKPTPRSFKAWTDENFLEYLAERNESNLGPIIFGLRDYAAGLGMTYSYGKGAYSPSIVFRIGKREVFKISGWLKKGVGCICTAEFGVAWHLMALGDDWTEDRLRKLISDLPERAEATAQGLIWGTQKYLYIDLRALLKTSSLEAFMCNIKILSEALSGGSNNSIIHIGQGMQVPT